MVYERLRRRPPLSPLTHTSDTLHGQPIKYRNGQVVERGQGNHVSVEFNILYRVRSLPPFHSPLPKD